MNIADFRGIYKKVNSFVHRSCIRKEVEGAEFIMMNTPVHGNLGDQAIAYSEKLFFKKHFPGIKYVEISGKKLWKYMDEYVRYIPKDAVIGIHGGGFLGTLWFNEEVMSRIIIGSFPDNRIIFFPQTVYFSEDDNGIRELANSRTVYEKHRAGINLFCRDKRSYEFCKVEFDSLEGIYLVPDMVLSLDGYKKEERGSKVLLCLRRDFEKTASDEEIRSIIKWLEEEGLDYEVTDTVVYRDIPQKQRDQELTQLFEKFAGAKFVITDRLHGMIISAVTGTPCLAMDNISRKVSGGYEMLKGLEYIRFWDGSQELTEELEDLKAISELNWKYDRNKLAGDYEALISQVESEFGLGMKIAT